MPIELERTTDGGVDVVHVRGEVDVLTAPALADELGRTSETDAARLVVDLDGVDFLDSTGLGVLVNARKRITGAGGRFSVASSNPRITKLFSITGLDELFDIHPDTDSAVSAASA